MTDTYVLLCSRATSWPNQVESNPRGWKGSGSHNFERKHIRAHRTRSNQVKLVQLRQHKIASVQTKTHWIESDQIKPNPINTHQTESKWIKSKSIKQIDSKHIESNPAESNQVASNHMVAHGDTPPLTTLRCIHIAEDGSRRLQMLPYISRWLQMPSGGSTCLQVDPKGSRCLQIGPGNSRYLQMAQNDSMAPDGSTWLQRLRIGPDGSGWLRMAPDDSTQLQMAPEMMAPKAGGEPIHKEKYWISSEFEVFWICDSDSTTDNINKGPNVTPGADNLAYCAIRANKSRNPMKFMSTNTHCKNIYVFTGRSKLNTFKAHERK